MNRISPRLFQQSFIVTSIVQVLALLQNNDGLNEGRRQWQFTAELEETQARSVSIQSVCLVQGFKASNRKTMGFEGHTKDLLHRVSFSCFTLHFRYFYKVWYNKTELFLQPLIFTRTEFTKRFITSLSLELSVLTIASVRPNGPDILES